MMLKKIETTNVRITFEEDDEDETGVCITSVNNPQRSVLLGEDEFVDLVRVMHGLALSAKDAF